MFKLILIVLVASALILAGLVIYLQEYLILPSITYRVFDYTKLPPGIEEARVTSRDGTELIVWSRKVPGSKGSVLMFHGNGDLLPYSYGHQDLFNRMGFDTYQTDYRGTGITKGPPREEGIKEDAEAVFQFVKAKAPNHRIFVFGVSFGSGPATFIAERHEPAGLILVSPYSSIPGVIADRGGFTLLRSFSRFAFSSESLISRMKGTPVLVLHGEKDLIIKPHHTAKLESAYRGTGTFTKILYPEGDHGNILQFGRADIANWLEKILSTESHSEPER